MCSYIVHTNVIFFFAKATSSFRFAFPLCYEEYRVRNQQETIAEAFKAQQSIEVRVNSKYKQVQSHAVSAAVPFCHSEHTDRKKDMFVCELNEKIQRKRVKLDLELDTILAGKFGVIVRITATVGGFD